MDRYVPPRDARTHTHRSGILSVDAHAVVPQHAPEDADISLMSEPRHGVNDHLTDMPEFIPRCKLSVDPIESLGLEAALAEIILVFALSALLSCFAVR